MPQIKRLPVGIALTAVFAAVATAIVLRFNFTMPRTIELGVPSVLRVIGCLRLEAWFRSPMLSGVGKMGDASYSLYLTHTIVLTVLTATISNSPLPIWLAGPILLVILTCH